LPVHGLSDEIKVYDGFSSWCLKIISNLEIVERQILYPCYQKFPRDCYAYLPALLLGEAKMIEELEQKRLSITTLDQLAIPSSDRFFDAAQALSQELGDSSQLPL